MTASGWPEADHADGGESPFDLAIRGYDRRQVDERLLQLGEQLAAANQALQEAKQRSAELSGQLYNAVTRLRRRGDGGQSDSFGFRVDKILRQATEEARELRARGEADAAALVAQATAETERQRREIGRVLADAMADAEHTRGKAQAQAAQLAAAMELELTSRRAVAEDELARLTELRDRVSRELRQVHKLLASLLPALAQRGDTGPGHGRPSNSREGQVG